MGVELSAGDYYIVVEGFNGATGLFDLLVQESPLSTTQSTWMGNLDAISEKLEYVYLQPDIISTDELRDCFVVGPDADGCGVCNGDSSSSADSADVPNGDAALDECGVSNVDRGSNEDY